MNIHHWKILDVSDDRALIALLDKHNIGDTIHGAYRDRLVRHGDDGGWCIDTKSRAVIRRLEKLRIDAGLPASGEVFYLKVTRP